ncbi:MAG TPA: hypothetical protein DF613_17540 [Lachnospiraceae bacterium]|nr:hypothetical protein [Lachnospiraceae bacterium]
MAVKMKQGMLAVLCLLCCLVLGAVPARAASGVKLLCSGASETTTVNADVTGNGKNDKIRLELTKGPYNGWIKETAVYVNGKKALSIKNEDNYHSVSLRHIHMTKSKTFLQITGRGDGGYRPVNRIYRYDKTKKNLSMYWICTTKWISPGMW